MGTKEKEKICKQTEGNNALPIAGNFSNDSEFLIQIHGGQKEMAHF